MKTPEFKRQDDMNDRVAQAKHRQKLLSLYPDLKASASNEEIKARISKDERSSLERDKKMQRHLESLKKAADEGKTEIIKGKTVDEKEWEGDLETK